MVVVRIGILGIVVATTAGILLSCEQEGGSLDTRGRWASGVAKVDNQGDGATGPATDDAVPGDSNGGEDSVDDGQGGKKPIPEEVPKIPPGEKIRLTWASNPESYLLGYKIFARESGSVGDGILVREVDVNDPTFNALAPSVTIQVKGISAFDAFSGKEVCFSVKARIDGKESPESPLSCLTFK